MCMLCSLNLDVTRRWTVGDGMYAGPKKAYELVGSSIASQGTGLSARRHIGSALLLTYIYSSTIKNQRQGPDLRHAGPFYLCRAIFSQLVSSMKGQG